jgi:bifunctional UDP-N-acetylglucosamine pyrophosphorylase/glucosamine-1-phosphate N-acetyltransferase
MLPPAISRVVIVVGYLGDRIREEIGDHSNNRQVEYVSQAVLDGTGGALRWARPLIRSERFLVVMGDDLYAARDLERLSECERAILVQTKVLHKDGMDIWDVKDGRVVGMSVGKAGETAVSNPGAYVLGHEWFEVEPVLTPGTTDEWSIPHAIPQLLEKHPFQAVEASFWQMCGTFEELAEAEKILGSSSS